jgi:membrane protein
MSSSDQIAGAEPEEAARRVGDEDRRPGGAGRRWRDVRMLAGIVGRELIRTRVIDAAAAVAFWSMMSMVPLLMTVVALMSLLRLPELAPQLLGVLAMLVPPNSLDMVESMAGTLLTPHRGVLSIGVVSYVWSSTGGFTSLISALDVAYDVQKERTWLRDRLQAVILTFTSGGLLTLSLLALLAGPHFAHFMGQIVPVPQLLERLWPAIRIATVFVCFVVGLELVYFLGPNVRQRFSSTLPGAIFAIGVWFAGSAGLSFYLDHFSGYSRMYGGMGAVMGLMFWIYLTALAVLIGAELNAELAKWRDGRQLGDPCAIRREGTAEVGKAA